MNHILQDLRYGFRLLRKASGMSAAAVLALALGIGANIAIFSFVDALWLRPLPIPGADRIVTLYTSMPTSKGESAEGTTSYPDLADLRAQSQTLTDLVASERRGAFLDDHSTARQLLVNVVSDNYSVGPGAVGRSHTGDCHGVRSRLSGGDGPRAAARN